MPSPYYVATTGDDVTGDGSFADPWGTISYGVSQLSAGETLYIRGGTYTSSADVIDTQVTTVPSGSAGNRITIRGYPAETVVLQPPDGVGAIRLTSGGRHYLTFQDLELDGSNQSDNGVQAVYVGHGSSHNEFIGLNVHHWQYVGFHFSNTTADSPLNRIAECRVHENVSVGTSRIHGIYVFCSDTTIEDNEIYDNEGWGVHAYNNTGPDFDRVIIRRNRIYRNGLTVSGAAGILVNRGSDHQIYNNLVYENESGIWVYANATDATVFHNTVYDNVQEGIALQYYLTGPTVRNNISYGNGSYDLVDYGGTGTPVMDHNWVTSDGDPGLVNPAGGDLALAAGSDCIDAGVDVGITDDWTLLSRPQGGGFDIGAYEYVPTAYYVALTGDNGDAGTFAEPWATISYGVSQLAAGDTLYIRGGTYTTADDVIDSQGFTVPSGSNWTTGAITIAAYPAETVTIQPPDNVAAIRFASTTVSYLIIQDLVCDGVNHGSSADAAIVFCDTCDHIRFVNVEATNANGAGGVLGSETSAFIEWIGGSSHHHGDGIDDPGTHGFYIVGSDWLLDGVWIHHNDQYGVHVYDNAGDHTSCSRNVVRNCVIQENSQSRTGAAILFAWGEDNIAYNNLILNEPRGVEAYTLSTNAQFYFNTIYSCTVGARFEYYATAPQLRNNIFRNCGTDYIDAGGTGTPVIDHNWLVADGDPEFVNPEAENFQLQGTSDCIDAGVDVGIAIDALGLSRPQGGGFDIGAYEFEVLSALEVTEQEGIRISESVALLGAEILVSLQEAVRVRDSLSIAGAVLFVSLTEGLKLSQVLPTPQDASQSLLQARADIERSGITRTGYYIPNLIVTIDGTAR